MDPKEVETKRKGSGLFADMYREPIGPAFSPLLFLIIGIVWLLRRLSLFEWIKAALYKHQEMPAALLDVYLLLVWIGTAVVAICDRQNGFPCGIRWLYLFIIVQIVQANFYHELWRPILLARRNLPLKVTYSRLRNLVIAFANFAFVTCLYGLVYWKSGNAIGAESPFQAPADAVYFAFTVAWTVGSESIPSGSLDNFVKGTIISQVLVTLFLASTILATAVSSIMITQEGRPRSED